MIQFVIIVHFPLKRSLCKNLILKELRKGLAQDEYGGTTAFQTDIFVTFLPELYILHTQFQSMSDRRFFDRQSRSDWDLRSPFGQKIALRSAIAKSEIGIAKTRYF